MERKIFVILGSPNSSLGELSDISKSRLNYCINHYQKENLVICTGGWGAHFNTTNTAHAIYAKEYLVERGFTEECFLDVALSENTVDDAVKIKFIVSKLENIDLTIITSDYHLERVKLIFNEIFESYNMTFVGVKSVLEKKIYETLVLHEEKAIKNIIKNGLYY